MVKNDVAGTPLPRTLLHKLIFPDTNSKGEERLVVLPLNKHLLLANVAIRYRAGMNDNKNGTVRTPTVSRVCSDTLIELTYDSEVRTTGLVVSRFGGLWNIEQEVRIATNEILVPYAATNNLIANKCVLLPSKPIEYGHKNELVADIRAYLHRYVDLSPLFEEIATYYVLLSWVHDAFSELPYLRLRGDYGTGKTRALLVIGSLCYKAFFASGASTVSPLFHTLNAFGGTLVLDEADMPFSDAKSELVKILNNGTGKDMPVLRTIVNRNREFNPFAFKVFGPKIIATRELFQDRALESRFLTEETGSRTLRADIPVHLPPEYKAEALELRNRLLHYRLCEFFNTNPDPSALMLNVEPRLNQVALSLLSLVEDPGLRADIQDFIIAGNHRALSERREAPEASVLTALFEAMSNIPGTDIAVQEVAERFNTAHAAEYGRTMTNKWIGNMLRMRLQLATRKARGVYVVPVTEHPKVVALAKRYGISEEKHAEP
ncbi:MAG TPA: hypothetical protein VGF97_13385 [Rhizomicrobium sp.]